jgi:hypothetical protein
MLLPQATLALAFAALFYKETFFHQSLRKINQQYEEHSAQLISAHECIVSW